MPMKPYHEYKIFDSLIERVTHLMVISIIVIFAFILAYLFGILQEDPVSLLIGILSLISALIALKVAWVTYKLQRKSDQDLKRIENSIDALNKEGKNIQENIEKISELQDKMIFETEKDRLMNFFQYFLSEENNKEFRTDVKIIFKEEVYNCDEIDETDETDKNIKRLSRLKLRFIKESNKQYALPKMAYPNERIHDFPYFCVQVVRKQNEDKKNQSLIELNKYYYLSYINTKPKTGWYIAEKYPIEDSYTHKSFKISFSGTNYLGTGLPTASDYCKDC